MRSLPHSRDTDSGITTSGVAYAIPTGSADPWFPATQATIYVSALAFIGFGLDDSPPAAADTNTVYQEGTTVVDYDIGDITARVPPTHIYVYAASGTIDARISWFG